MFYQRNDDPIHPEKSTPHKGDMWAPMEHSTQLRGAQKRGLNGWKRPTGMAELKREKPPIVASLALRFESPWP